MIKVLITCVGLAVGGGDATWSYLEKDQVSADAKLKREFTDRADIFPRNVCSARTYNADAEIAAKIAADTIAAADAKTKQDQIAALILKAKAGTMNATEVQAAMQLLLERVK